MSDANDERSSVSATPGTDQLTVSDDTVITVRIHVNGMDIDEVEAIVRQAASDVAAEGGTLISVYRVPRERQG